MKKRFGFLAILLFAALPSIADSISFTTFALQDHPVRLVHLDGDPLLTPVPGLGQQDLTFATEFGSHVGVFVFSFTLSLPNFESTHGPSSLHCGADSCIVGFGWIVPLSYKVVAGTLSVTVDGVTQNYDFRYQSAAPEPNTILLLGTGLAGVVWRKWRSE